MRRFTSLRRGNVSTSTGHTRINQPNIVSWLLACTLGLPRIQIKKPITLSHQNQATRFKEFTNAQNATRPVETGDHLISHYQQFIFHNMMMYCLYVLHIDNTNTPVTEKQNNGLRQAETEEDYITRFSEKTIRNWALAITNDINCFAIQEGVVKQNHIPIFKKAVQKNLACSGWKLRGGTDFGLWFLVRKEYEKEYNLDTTLSAKLKAIKLDSRCLTLSGPTEKVSNIHVPHAEPEESYKKIVRAIFEDMLDQLDLQKSKRILLTVQHIDSENEHIKDGATRCVSVSGITEFTMHYGNKKVSHKVLGDFNLGLSDRQQLDQAVFSEIKEKFDQAIFAKMRATFDWTFKTIIKNTKYIAGLVIGGGLTISTDFAAADEAGIVATFGRTAFFSEKMTPVLEKVNTGLTVVKNLSGGVF